MRVPEERGQHHDEERLRCRPWYIFFCENYECTLAVLSLYDQHFARDLNTGQLKHILIMIFLDHESM